MPQGQGPPYPHPNPVPGSNAIGLFQIGVSPIGTIPSFDPWITILSQYGNSQAIDGVVTAFNAAMDQTATFDDFFDVTWNVATATGAGLDRIGRVVNVSRTLQLPSGAVPFLGFEEAGDPLFVPFGQGTFFAGANSLTSNFQLADSDYRTLIYAKMAANICDGSIPAINQVLLTLFPNRGNAYVADGENMTMEYVFAFNLSAVELAIVEQSGALPKPVGVSVTVVQP
jgi:hypothetical protein